MVELDYIAASARAAARRPGMVIARATLRHFGLPYPPVREERRRYRHRDKQAYEGIAEAFVNRGSPMDCRS